MEARGLRTKHHLRGIGLGVVALTAVLALAIGPARAHAATPVLEYAPVGSSPISFDLAGGGVSANLGEFDRIVSCSSSNGHGEITGPRTTLSSYAFKGCVAKLKAGGGVDLKCTSQSAAEEEILAKNVEAELVYLDQAKNEVAMLLNPDGGVYMEFDCGSIDIKAKGPFLAPVNPVNTLTQSFTAELKRDGNSQIHEEYEDLDGVRHQAIPTGEVDGELDNSGVELSFAIQTSAALQIKSMSTAQVEAKQRQEEEAAANKRQEEEAAAKKRQEEEAAAKKRAEEEAARRLADEKAKAIKPLTKGQLRAKAMKRCRSLSTKQKRVRCETRVKKKYSPPKGNKGPKGGVKS